MKLFLLYFFSFSLLGAFAQDSLYSKVFYLPNIDIHTASVHPDLGDGLFIACNSIEEKGILLSVDSLGNELWKERLTAQGYGISVTDAIATADSSHLVTGSAMNYVSGNHVAFLTKVSEDGMIEWSRALGGDDNFIQARKVMETLDSAYVITGVSGVNSTNYNVFVAKIDRQGNLLWSTLLEGTGGNDIKSVRQAADSSFYLTGNASINLLDVDGLLINVSKDGALNWSKHYDDLPGCDLEMAHDGVFILCKDLQSQTIGLMKCDFDGADQWLKVYNMEHYNSLEEPVRMTMLADSTFVVVHGSSFMGNVFSLNADGDFVNSRELQLNVIDVARSKNKGVFAVGDGPLLGIKSLIAYDHIGIVRLDSTLQGNDCIWGDNFSPVLSPGVSASDWTLTASGTLEINDFAMIAETLELMNYFGCVDQLGGIEESGQSLALTVYPNSSAGIFNFTQQANDHLNISICNMNGQEIFNVRSSSISTQIDLSKCSSGVYLYKAMDVKARSAAGKLILL